MHLDVVSSAASPSDTSNCNCSEGSSHCWTAGDHRDLETRAGGIVDVLKT